MITQKLRTLILEDDLAHQQHLEKLIKQNHPELHLIGSCSSGTEALATIKSVHPELIMIDIDLRDMNAFEMLEQLHEINFHIVFTTGYNEYAIKAFRVNAVDYLLKPIIADELAQSIQKVLLQRNLHKNYESLIADYQNINKRFLTINEKKKVTFVPIDQILYLQADRSYSTIHYKEDKERKKITTCTNLSTLEKQLLDHDFIRIHQSYLVNRLQIHEFLKKDKKIKLICGDLLPVARGKTELIIGK